MVSGGGFPTATRGLKADYAGVMIHDGWSPYDTFAHASHQQCLGHLLRRCHDLLETATRGAVRFPRRIQGLLQAALDLRDRHAAGRVSDHGLAVARGRVANELAETVFPHKSHPAHERLAKHLWNHLDQLLRTSNRQAEPPRSN
jgi:transposase